MPAGGPPTPDAALEGDGGGDAQEAAVHGQAGQQGAEVALHRDDALGPAAGLAAWERWPGRKTIGRPAGPVLQKPMFQRLAESPSHGSWVGRRPSDGSASAVRRALTSASYARCLRKTFVWPTCRSAGAQTVGLGQKRNGGRNDPEIASL